MEDVLDYKKLCFIRRRGEIYPRTLLPRSGDEGGQIYTARRMKKS